MNSFKVITPEKAKEIMDNNPDCMIIDVREEAEFIIEHIENAELLTLSEISEETASELIPSKDTLLLVYCKTGKRSRQACYILSALGYTNVNDFGGIIDWPYGLTWE